MKTINWKKEALAYFYLIFGSLLFAVGDILFVNPYILAPGGTYGLSNVLNTVWPWKVSLYAICHVPPPRPHPRGSSWISGSWDPRSSEMTELDPSVCSSAHVGGTPTLMSVDSLSSELKRVQRWDHRNRPGFWPGRRQLFLPLASLPLMRTGWDRWRGGCAFISSSSRHPW